MTTAKSSFIGKECKLALHSSGQMGTVKKVIPIKYAAGLLTYEENGKVFHTTLSFILEEIPSEEV